MEDNPKKKELENELTPNCQTKNLTIGGQFFMAKYSYEFKKKIVLEYLNSDEGCISISRKYGMTSSSQLLKWVSAYKAFGDNGLKRSRSQKIYSFKEKLSVVESYLTNEISYQELAIQVGINNPSMIACEC